MKFLNVNATIILKPVFEGDVLKAGTPLDINGAIANSDAAVGLVASDTAKGAESIAVVTEGTIDLTEVAASYGTALTDDCIAALKGITFLYGGKAVVPAGGSGLPDYSEASDGDVLSIENGAPAWKPASGGVFAFKVTLLDMVSGEAVCNKTANEILAAYKAGMTMVCTIDALGGFDTAPALVAIATNGAGTSLTSVHALSAYLSLGDPILGDPPALNVCEVIYESGTWTVNYRDIYSAS